MSKAPEQVGTSTTTNSPPPYIQGAQLAMLNAAANLTLPFASVPPSQMVANLTPDQNRAAAAANTLVDQSFGGGPTQVSQFGNYFANPVNATAEQLGDAGVRQFFNPYQRDVTQTTARDLMEANDKQIAAIRARQAAEGAYGGNRAALEVSEQNRNFGNILASALSGINERGWQNAANLGMGNTQMRQQTGLQNAAWQQQANLFNAQQPLQVAQIQNQLNQADWQKRMQSLQALMGTGAMQREAEQQKLNAPFTALDIYRQAVPSATGNTSTQPVYGASALQSIAPLAMLAGGLFSDRTMKTDIKKLGTNPKTGLTDYAYRYKGDPKHYPKVVGPMAQDVEKAVPGSTVRVGGKLAIKPAARMMLGI